MLQMNEIFECKQCGTCCKGETTVSLNEQDVDNMLHSLGMEREKVAEKYWRITGDTIQMKTVEGRCIFYREGCTIHSGKPWRCTQWPLHPSMLSEKSSFEIIKTYCPGINQTLSYEDFCSKFKFWLDKNPVTDANLENSSG